MCSKTCRASNLFCMICLLVELTSSQSPISPYNLAGGGNPQHSPFSMSFGEQIHPVQGRPTYFQRPYDGSVGGVSAYGQQPVNPIVSRQLQQELFLQQQQRMQNMGGYRGGFGGFAPPSFGAPIQPQASFQQQQRYNANSFGAAPGGIINSLYGSPTDTRSDIPTEIVIGRQAPQPARERFGPPATSAFGSPLANGANSESLSPDHLLQSINAIERNGYVHEAEAGAAAIPPVDSQLPKFLQGAPSDAVDSFKRIIREPNVKYEDQVKRIETMVGQKLDPEHQALYREFMRENDEREEHHRERIHKIVSQMSSKAQEQFAKISAILRGPGTPESERWDRVLNVYSRMEPQLRDEFEAKFKDFGVLQSAL